MDESEELSGLEGMLVLTWVSLAVISCTNEKKLACHSTNYIQHHIQHYIHLHRKDIG